MPSKILLPSAMLILLTMVTNPSYADKGQVEIISKPGDAKIYINGKRKGTTPSEIGQSFVIELKEGEYTIEAVIPSTGQFEQYAKKEIFVADDTLQPVSLKLEKRASSNFRKDLKRKHPNPIEPEMVSIQGGSFRMGCVSGSEDCGSDEKPVHTVTVGSFLMGKYEVTFNEWDACVAAGGCSHYPIDDKSSRGQRAVNKVSWNDVQEYIKWLNQETGKEYRLPTEAEWEYAARAGTKTKYSWGNSKKSAGKYAWYDKNAYDVGDKYAHRVGTKKPNPWGLNDMYGNVWEWTRDWYDEKAYSNSEKNNPMGPSSGRYRVIRGGGWVSNVGYLRSADRSIGSPDGRDDDLGFRLMRKP